MMTTPSPPASGPRTDRDTVRRLRDLLSYVPGDYSVVVSAGGTVCVTAYGDSPSPLSEGVALSGSEAVEAVQRTLDRLQIPARVSPSEGFLPTDGVRIELTTARDAGALADWAEGTLSPPDRACRRLYLALTAAGFQRPDRLVANRDTVGELPLDVDLDVAKLRAALGLPEDSTVIHESRGLYPYADRLADALRTRLSAPSLEAEAHPFRPFCRDCDGNLIVVSRLTPGQADRTSAALETSSPA